MQKIQKKHHTNNFSQLTRRQWLLRSLMFTGLAASLSQCSRETQNENVVKANSKNTLLSNNIQPHSEIAFLGKKLTKPAQRIVLAQSRLLPNLNIVDADITKKLVGWSQDLKRLYPSEFDKWVEVNSAIKQLPIVGDGMAQTLSTEKILSLKPDLVIFSRPNVGPATNDSTNNLFNLLIQANISILVVDFFIHPLQNTVASLRAIASVLGTNERSEKFIAIYEQRLSTIKSRLIEHKPKRPKVFMHAHAGSNDCCYSAGTGVFNDFINVVGGHNLAADLLKTPTGQIAKEYIFTLQPEVYLASGTSTKNSVSKFNIGPDVSAEQAQKSLHKIIEDADFGSLSAVKNHRAFGFWHAFNDSPAHIILLEVLAKWLHPTIFSDFKPEDTLELLNQQFIIPPLKGTFWTQL